MANILKTPPFPLFVALFSNPFYTFTNRIFEQCGLPVSHRRLHLLECTLLLLHLFRLASFALEFYDGSPLISWDPLVQYFASQPHLYDRYLLACFLCLVVYTLTLNWQMFLGEKRTNGGSKGSISWQAVAYELTVQNTEQARRCCQCRQVSNLELRQGNRKCGLLSVLLRQIRFLSDRLQQIRSDLLQKHLDLGKLGQARYQLTDFAFLSVKIRKKCLQFQCFSNLVARLLPFITLLVPLLGMTLQVILGVLAITGILTPFRWLLLLTDVTLIWIYCLLFYRNALLLAYLVIITSLASKWHLQAANSSLVHLIAKCRSRTFQSLNPWNRLLLGNILTEHAQLCALLDASNGQIISLVLFSSFLLNAPTNIYFIYRLVYRPVLPIEFTAILVFITAQILCLSSAVVPAAWANGALSRTGKYLPGVQLSVLRGERCRSLKFKYEILQSTLTESRVKSGASFGPVCLITFESLYKVVTLYAVYMIAFFDLLPK